MESVTVISQAKRRRHRLGDRIPDANAACQILEATVAAAFRLPVSELRASTRQRARVAFARQIAMYVAHVELGMSLTEVGRWFRRDRTTAAHACRVVEECRDRSDVDQVLNRVVTALSEWNAAMCTGQEDD